MMKLTITLKEETSGEPAEIATWEISPVHADEPVKMKFVDSRRYLELIVTEEK